MKKIYTILICMCLLASFVACEKDKDFLLTKLTVQNETITPSYGSATIDCSFKPDATISEAFVHYSLSSSFAKYDVAKMTEEKGKYVAQLTDLQDNTTYYIRYAVSNKYSSAVTEEVMEFQTLQCTAPTIALDSIADVWDNRAKAHIHLTFDGGASVTDMGICWSKQANPTIEDIHKSTKDTVAVLDMTDLQEHTQYYVRAYAVNKVGTVYSEEHVLTTFALPEVRTEEVTDIRLNSAQLTATLLFDGNDTATIKGFCWSDKAEPTIDANHIAVDTTSAHYTYLLSELLPATEYHIRAYAKNKIGVAYGEEKTFTTTKDVVSPTVTTATVTQITETTAVAGGNVTSDGGAEITERGVVYATTQNPMTADNKVSNGSGMGTFTCNLTDLQANTTYYVRAYAINSKGTAYGEEVTFITNKQIVLPSVTTATVTQITETTAVAGGNVTSDGGASVTERGVVYATTQNPTTADNKVSNGSGMGTFTCNLTDLQPNTSYYIRAYAINEKGTAYGEEVTFITNKQIVLPSVTTATVTQITETTAVAGGNVTSDGNASVTERGVVYATTQNPTTADNKVLNGSGMGTFTCNLTDLQPNTTYYVRAYATNSMGTAYGEEVSFTTEEEVVAIPEYVDLGLSVKWATFNVGATKPEEFGDYFAWGETEPKEKYDWSTYKWCNGTDANMTKYNATDGKIILELEDDAAYMNWGGNWRIPTMDEMNELSYQCTWTVINKNGVNGYKVTSKSNSNSIFIPFAGYYNGSLFTDVDVNGYYWSSVLQSNGHPNFAWRVCLKGFTTNTCNKCLGHSIRPVYGEYITYNTPTITTNIPTQITSTTAVAGGNVTSDGGASVTERGVVYSINQNPTTADNKIPNGSGMGSFTCNLTSLQPNTTYYVRAYAINETGTAYGEEVTFTTNKQIVLPSVITATVTQITETAAVAGGNVTSDGGASVTERGVVFATTQNPTTNNTKVMSGTGTGSFTCNLTGLQQNTTYYVRAYAVNIMGTAYGEEVYFTTEGSLSDPMGTENGYGYVDLGLSVKWATYNVGATSPEEYGSYFAWGETTTKSIYNSNTYKYFDASSLITKYNTKHGEGNVDNKTTLDLSDDAAHANWGGNWRMPTSSEWTELRENCTWRWITQNGKNGYKVTSKSNGNSIFLRAAGYRLEGSHEGATNNGFYWSSSLDTDYTSRAWGLHFGSSGLFWINSERYLGQPVRPVLGESVVETTIPTVTTTIPTQITETTALAGGNVTADGNASVTERGVVYATTQNPTINNTKVTSGIGTGSFTCNLTDLQPNTTYYVRAYAINEKGTAYGEEVNFTTNEQSNTPNSGTENGHEYVDLGLSVKWATCNVGASYPEDYGDYYKWYTSFSSSDIANETLGGKWRTPTNIEFNELIDNSIWTWSSSKKGYIVTSKKNEKTIFLPAAGFDEGEKGKSGYYWSSTINTTSPQNAYALCFTAANVEIMYLSYHYYYSIRPVCP